MFNIINNFYNKYILIMIKAKKIKNIFKNMYIYNKIKYNIKFNYLLFTFFVFL